MLGTQEKNYTLKYSFGYNRLRGKITGADGFLGLSDLSKAEEAKVHATQGS